MSAVSWILTIAALIALGACFVNEVWIWCAGPLAILASWTDKIAIEHELQEFRSRGPRP